MNNICLRYALVSDAKKIQSIYEYYVLNSVATFEITPPSKKEMEKRIKSIIDEGYPFIVATYKEEVVGFTYAKMYYGREGFKPTVENSIYVDKDIIKLKLHIGNFLMKELILQTKKMGVKNIIAYVGGGKENIPSINIHEKFGFKLIGVYKKIGLKFGNYHDMAGLQLILD